MPGLKRTIEEILRQHPDIAVGEQAVRFTAKNKDPKDYIVIMGSGRTQPRVVKLDHIQHCPIAAKYRISGDKMILEEDCAEKAVIEKYSKMLRRVRKTVSLN